MKIAPIKTNKQDNPSFQMNISCDEKALKLLEKSSLKDYNEASSIAENFYGQSSFDFKKLFSDFQQAFGEYTKELKGDVTLKVHPFEDMCKDQLMISYKGEDGKICELADGNGAPPIEPRLVLRKFNYPFLLNKGQEKPFFGITLDFLSIISDLILDTGKFHNMPLHRKLSEDFYKIASKITPEEVANIEYRDQYVMQVKAGAIDDVLNYGIKKEKTTNQ